MHGFKSFILRGNVVDLAVAVIIGAAFGQVVDSVVKGVVDPLLGAIVGQPNFDQAAILGPVHFGLVITAIINFILKAGVVYFIIVIPTQRMLARFAPVAAAAAPAADVVLLTEIRDLLAKRPG